MIQTLLLEASEVVVGVNRFLKCLKSINFNEMEQHND